MVDENPFEHYLPWWMKTPPWTGPEQCNVPPIFRLWKQFSTFEARFDSPKVGFLQWWRKSPPESARYGGGKPVSLFGIIVDKNPSPKPADGGGKPLARLPMVEKFPFLTEGQGR